jgi:hypothetical protein
MLSSSRDGVEAGLLFASILGIVEQWTEEESLQLIEIYKTNAILWDPKHINHYKKKSKIGRVAGYWVCNGSIRRRM